MEVTGDLRSGLGGGEGVPRVYDGRGPHGQGKKVVGRRALARVLPS